MTTAADPLAALRDYQRECLAASRAAFGRGVWSQLIVSATGSGKTTIFAHLTHVYADWLEQFPPMQRKVLVIAHRDRLLDQAARQIARYNGDLRIGTEQASRRHSPFDDVVVASVQTLTAHKHRMHGQDGVLRMHDLDPNAFRIVVVDEAHRVASDSYQKILRYFGLVPPMALTADATDDDQTAARTRVRDWWAQGWPNKLLLGTTATPSRTDLVGLEWTFREVVYERPLRWYIERGYLAPLSGYVLRTSVSVDGIKRTAGDFNQKQLGALLNTPARNEAIVTAWQQCASNRRATLVFCVDVAHARDLAACFRRRGVAADSIAGDDADRDERLAEFERGDLQVLVNCQLLTEGIDIPAVDCVVMAAPTQSQIRYMQAIGRGTRTAPNKENCLILDVVDDSRKYKIQSGGDIFGLPPRYNGQGTDLLKAARAIEQAEARQPSLVIDDVDLNPQTLIGALERVDLWGPSHASGAPLALGRLSWSELRAGRYTIAVPPIDDQGRIQGGAVALAEVVTVEQTLLGGWSVAVRCGTRLVDQLATSLDTLAEAIERGERWVQHHRPHAWGIFQKGARWRDLPASAKQIATLTRLGAPVADGLTKGQASDMLDGYFARTRRG